MKALLVLQKLELKNYLHHLVHLHLEVLQFLPHLQLRLHRRHRQIYNLRHLLDHHHSLVVEKLGEYYQSLQKHWFYLMRHQNHRVNLQRKED
tara:strand:+ start:356 stop:631 length:276 start_codon:yes stop_codon:yes gene_type:complete